MTLPGSGLAGELWAANADLARAALEHDFVRGLADGRLPLPAFQRYVAQDAYFLESFARAYALALAHSPDRDGLHAFAELLAGVREELALHGSYAAEWGVNMSDVEPAEATLAYTDFLLATAALADVGLVCAAMTPCMRLYAHLGATLAAETADAGAPAGPYAAWITTYADPGFAALADRLEALLDRYATDKPEIRRTYRRAMSLEVAFFSAALPRSR